MSKLPAQTDLTSLIGVIQGELGAYHLDEMDLTIGWDPKTGEWSWQTGDNSFTGSAYLYPIWAVGTVDNETDPTEMADYLIDQLAEQTEYYAD